MENLTFSYPYLIFTVLLMALAVIERTYRHSLSAARFCRFGCVALYLLFIGLRGYIGTDWYAYRIIFDDIPSLFSGDWMGFWSDNLLGPGFVFFTSAVKTVWNDYHFFVFVNACLDAVVVHVFLRRYVSWYTLGFLVFFVMGGLTLCELLRNARGIGLFLLSLKYLTERRPGPYFLLNGLGCLFHFPSLVYLPLYWLLHRKWPKRLFITIFLIGNAVFLLRLEFLRPLLEQAAETLGGHFAYLGVQYLADDAFDERYALSLGYLERIATSLLILGFWRKLHRQREVNALFINAYILYFAFFFFCSELRVLAARGSLLFIFAYWVLFPALYETLLVRFNRLIFMSMLFVYCGLKIAGMTSIPLYRYDNLLWGIERYGRRADEFDRYYLNR